MLFACVLWSLAALAGNTPSAAAAAPIQVRIGSLAPPGTPWLDDLELYKKDMVEATHGQIRPKIILAAGRGSEADIVQAALQGDTLQFIGVSSGALVDLVPALEVLELPFLFESPAEADFVFDNYLVEPVRRLLREKGLEFFDWCENGWLNIGTTKRPVRSPHDLVGMRVRSQPSKLHVLTWKTFGANPVEISLSETGAALADGRVEGFSQTTLLTLAQGWAKSTKYYTVMHYIYQPLIIAYSKRFFDAQTEAVRTALMQRSEKYSASDRKAVRAIEASLLAQYESMGVQVETISPKDRAMFMEQARRVQDKFVHTAPPEALALLHVVVQGKAAFAKAQSAEK